MAWVTPRNWVPTERVTATMLNQHIRDNMNALRADQVLAIVPRTDTGAINNWAPPLSSAQTFIEWNGAADGAITGLAGGATGMQVTIKNITTSKVATFAFNSGSSLTANRFQNLATSAPTPIAPGGWIRYVYDGTDWKLAEHEQGAWIAPAYNSADYFATAPMTWTVDSGDVTTDIYKLSGRTLFRQLVLATTTVGGTVGTALKRTIPGGFTCASQMDTPYMCNPNAAGNRMGLIAVLSGTVEQFFADLTLATNWILSTNTTSLFAIWFIQVT